jgi:elongation factor Tu
MPIDDVFALKAHGKVVVVGVIEEGAIRPGDSLTIQSGEYSIPVLVESLEAYHKPLNSAKAGDRVGILLHGIDKDKVVLPANLVSTELAGRS